MSCNSGKNGRHVVDIVYPASKDINGTVCDNDLSTSTQSLDKQMQTVQARTDSLGSKRRQIIECVDHLLLLLLL